MPPKLLKPSITDTHGVTWSPITIDWWESADRYLFCSAFGNVDVPKPLAELPDKAWMEGACQHLWETHQDLTWEGIRAYHDRPLIGGLNRRQIAAIRRLLGDDE